MQIDFFSLRFALGEELRFQYKLEGAVGDWSAPSDQRSINYANISPGTYRFLVRAVSSDGLMSPSPATVAFQLVGVCCKGPDLNHSQSRRLITNAGGTWHVTP